MEICKGNRPLGRQLDCFKMDLTEIHELNQVNIS
jgi:hypothetical protein